MENVLENNGAQKKTDWNYEMLFVQAIAIISMVLGHSGHALPILGNAIFPYYSWHMPLFVFISGYFLSAKGGYLSFVGHKCKRLLLPAFCVRLALALLGLVATSSGLLNAAIAFTPYSLLVDPFISCGAFPFSDGMWFIFQLFLLELLMGALLRIPFKHIRITVTLLSLLISLATLYVVYYRMPEAPQGITLLATRTAFLLFFMAAGHQFRQWEGKLRVKPWLVFSIVVLAQAAFLVLSGSEIEFSAHTMEIQETPFFFSPIVTTLTAAAALICIAKMLSPLLQGNRLVLAIGGHTKDVLYFHQICLLLVNCVYMVVYHRTGSKLFDGFYYDMIRAAWYAFPLGGVGLGQLPYVLFSIAVPVAVPSFIRSMKKRWQQILVVAVIWALIAVYFIAMGKYAVEAVGLPR